MEIIIICFIVAMFCIILLIADSKDKDKSIKAVSIKSNELRCRFDKIILLGFESSNGVLNYVGFDNKNKSLAIKSKGYSEKIIRYDDITKIELIENGKTSMSISNIIGGAVLAGSAGAIIGAMNKNEKIVSRRLKFSLNDFNNPSYELNLIDNGKTYEYRIDLILETNKLIDTIKYIIEK